MAKEFRAWVQDIKAPEEFFYATLARIDQKSAENAYSPPVDPLLTLTPNSISKIASLERRRER